jgi:hypothetical protein
VVNNTPASSYPLRLGSFNGSDTSDMLLHSGSTGGLEVYDTSINHFFCATPTYARRHLA